MSIKSPRLTEKELKEFWKIDELKFTGQYAINKQGKGYFRNIRRLDGNLCLFPDNSTVTIPASNITILEIDREYIINAFVAPEARRREIGKKYLLYLDTNNKQPIINSLSPKQYVNKLYEQYQLVEGIAKDALKGSIKRLAIETNKKVETFIYEILQNADDYPDLQRKRVNIRFKMVDEYLVVIHNGQPFKQNNVYAICTVDSGDKERDFNKTGFKGIGFKSIFKHSNFVWIHSGEFSFRFDEEFHKRKGDETFWQVIPIWTELAEVEDSVKSPDIVNAPVAIIIKPKEGQSRLAEYENIFKEVFQDERLLLFLRSVDSLTFQKGSEVFTKERSIEKWEISELPEIKVPKELQEKINQIIDKGSDERIPEKYKDITSTKITFATQLKNEKVTTTDNTRIYAYLPTDLNFGLPFLINSDFIPDGSRDKLFWDLDWNQFLFVQAGYSFIEWLGSIYVKYKDSSAVKLVPDLDRLISDELDEAKKSYLMLFKEGVNSAIEFVPFIPATDGNLYKLSELIIDETNLVELLGEKLFREFTGIESPVMDQSYSRERIIRKLEEVNSFCNKYSKDGLLLTLKSEAFRVLISKPDINVKFLKLLEKLNWLDDFKSEEIFLDQIGNLQKGNSIYYSLEEDNDLLRWLEIPVLNDIVKNKFKENHLPITYYDPEWFIEHYILENKLEIDELLDKKESNIKFYQYLFKYHEKLLQGKYFIDDKLNYFKVLGYDEQIISSFQGDNIYLVNDTIKRLIERKVLVEDQIHLLDRSLFHAGDYSDKWTTFWKMFGVKELSDRNMDSFIQSEIIDELPQIQKYYRFSNADSQISRTEKHIGNIELWLFLFNAMPQITKAKEKAFCEAISSLPVYTLDSSLIESLKNCYLSNYYTGNQVLENLVNSNDNLEVSFISNIYLKNDSLSTEKWKGLFEKFHVKIDVKDLIKHHLLPIIGDINEENLVATTQLIFENRKFLDEELGSVNIKLKTISGDWMEPNETIIGTHFTKNPFFETLLPSIPFGNEISIEYAKGKLPEWVSFFRKLGSLTYETSQEIIAAKINLCVINKVPLESAEKSLAIVKELISLHELNTLVNENYIQLQSMYLLVKVTGQAKFRYARTCHFSQEYNPILNLEKYIPEDQIDIFLSDKYITHSGSLTQLLSFFKKIGVKNNFYIKESNQKLRTGLNPDYRISIDQKEAKIVQNAQQWSAQHYIHPWRELLYQNYLNIDAVALEFWKTVVSDEGFRQKVFEKVNYYCMVHKPLVDNYILWNLRNSPCVPAKNGICYKPSEFFTIKYKSLIKDSANIPAIDLSATFYQDKSLEELLGFKMNLTLDVCLERFNSIKDVKKLKKEGIWNYTIKMLGKKNAELLSIEKSALEEFKSKGFLPNQLEEWKPIEMIFYVDPNFDLGIGNSPWIIHKELASSAGYLRLRQLSAENFNPVFRDIEDDKFQKILNGRLKFIAIAEYGSTWSDQESIYQSKLEGLNFWKTSRISFCFKEVDPEIVNTEKTFFVDTNEVYYVGNWNGPRAVELFSYIHEKLELKIVSLKTLKDLLLLRESEILELFEEKFIEYPASWKPVFSSIKTPSADNAEAKNEEKFTESKAEQEKDTKTNENVGKNYKGDLTDEEVSELESLFNRPISNDEMANTLIVALFRALKFYEANDYDIEAPSANIEKAIKKRMLEGIKLNGSETQLTVLVRSAKMGILRLNYQAWTDLKQANTELFVVTGNSSSDYLLFPDHKSLAVFNKDSWVAKIGGDDKFAELTSLEKGEYLHPDKKYAPLQFLIRIKQNGEYQSIFERIYSKEDSNDFENLD